MIETVIFVPEEKLIEVRDMINELTDSITYESGYNFQLNGKQKELLQYLNNLIDGI